VRFPFSDASFDVVIAVSVFTHLLPETALTYLKESHRVLSPGGRLFTTWFVWPTETSATMAAVAEFPVDCGSYRIATRDNPEAVVAFLEPSVIDMYRTAGLQITKTVQGNWIRDEHRLPYQDILVAIKMA
jgi:SAM-dependent methyltransferase